VRHRGVGKRARRVSLLGVAAHKLPNLKKQRFELKPGNHISGARAETRHAFKFMLDGFDLEQLVTTCNNFVTTCNNL
jgi:hypothetical protein